MTTSTATAITVSNAERIGKTVAEIGKRLRIQEFDIIGIQGTLYSGETVGISIQTPTRRDLNKAACYFQLATSKDLAGGTTMYAAAPVPGLGGATVMVYGPTTDPADQ